jgi:hypothetical protein
MWYLTDVAEWFDRQRSESDSILDSWVENSKYSISSMVGASVTKAFMTFGGGFVDLLRIGDGVKEGTLKGAGTDALRFLAIFPVGKAVSLLKTARGVVPAKFIIDPGGPNCFWVASAQALRQVGQTYKGRLLVGVDDLAHALKMPMDALWRIPNLSTGLSYLMRLGVKSGPIRKVSSHQDIARLLPMDGRVVMIAVHFTAKRGYIDAKHAIYAFRNSFGQVRYMDRTVGKQSSVAYKNIDDFLKIFKNYSAITPIEAAILNNLFAKTVGAGVEKLFIPILGAIAEDRKQ